MNVGTMQKTTKKTTKERRRRFLSNSGRMLLGALILLGIGLFTGCESAGAGNGDTTEPADPTEEDFSAAAEPLENAASGDGVTASVSGDPEITGEFVVSNVHFAMTQYIAFAEFVDRWDGSESFTYTDGDETVTVTLEEGDDLWRLTYSLDADGDTVTFVYEMEKESDRWAYSLEKGNASTDTLIEGELLFGGRSGSFTVYGEDNYPDKAWTLEWSVAGDPYHTAYTAEGYSDGSVDVTATVTTTLDGTSGEWTYKKDGHTEDGSW